MLTVLSKSAPCTTFSVLLRVVAEVTPRVPTMLVLPLSVSTVNLAAPVPSWIESSLPATLIVRPSVRVVRPSTSRVPLTVRLSSTIVSEVAESRVRLPAVVLISELPSTASFRLLAVISSDVIAAVKVEVALTVKLSVELEPRVALSETVRSSLTPRSPVT